MMTLSSRIMVVSEKTGWVRAESCGVEEVLVLCKNRWCCGRLGKHFGRLM